MEKKKRFLEDAFDNLKDLTDIAEIDEDSDIPVTEKKTKEKRFLK